MTDAVAHLSFLCLFALGLELRPEAAAASCFTAGWGSGSWASAGSWAGVAASGSAAFLAMLAAKPACIGTRLSAHGGAAPHQASSGVMIVRGEGRTGAKGQRMGISWALRLGAEMFGCNVTHLQGCGCARRHAAPPAAPWSGGRRGATWQAGTRTGCRRGAGRCSACTCTHTALLCSSSCVRALLDRGEVCFICSCLMPGSF